ncbi:uncharacterized protein LOC114890889 [Monodon monoceros]|uniref:uncharacterized protein LOC114890889 n=1 Tax=Monodon monoceros TaxID=40151 RepID=UPI0010F98791|nr:uncharacterized protein LOC114890889 [Monodon monoceros]
MQSTRGQVCEGPSVPALCPAEAPAHSPACRVHRREEKAAPYLEECLDLVLTSFSSQGLVKGATAPALFLPKSFPARPPSLRPHCLLLVQGDPRGMVALKRRLWGLLRVPRSHTWRRVVGGASQSYFLLRAPSGVKPGFAPASSRGVSGGLQEAAARLLPVVLAQPSRPCSGEDPGPRTQLGGGLWAAGRELPLAGCLLPEILCPPTPTAGYFRSLQRPHKAPPPEFSPKLKLSCAQIPAGWTGLS